ncbi:MAG TPA: ATP-binding protein [Bacteroidales bacterium]|nr:ATP-binding protein [Bacteroidales bacterium]
MMVLDRFFISICVRVSLLALTCILFGIILQHVEEGYYFTLAGTSVLIVFQILMLIKKVNRTNYDLEKFLSSVQNQDASVRFTDSGNRSFSRLHGRMNSVNAIIQDVRFENESTRNLLQTIVDHLDVGLLAIGNDGRIEFFNNASAGYLKIQKHGLLSSAEHNDAELNSILKTIIPGQEILYKMKSDAHSQSILIKASKLTIGKKPAKLITFENITGELARKELDSWQKLIRVLTHEIMNSISPITSLTSVISGYFKNKEDESTILPGKITSQVIEKTLSGLSTIGETGNGLLEFVEKYRSLTLLPEPNRASFRIQELFNRCRLLMASNAPRNIRINVDVFPEDLQLTADFGQVEQILINLVKNAIEAIGNKKNGIVNLKAFQDDNRVTILVEDNGPGIPGDVVDDIFVPFFSTKENGHGIGLSLARQIMQNHNGTIFANSSFNCGTQFTLRFPTEE